MFRRDYINNDHDDPSKCNAVSIRREGSSIQRIPYFSRHRCDRKAKVTMRHAKTGTVLRLCTVHARMAREGFYDGNGEPMDPNSRADYKRGLCGTPPDAGLWEEVTEA
jgi:hypothetical protein